MYPFVSTFFCSAWLFVVWAAACAINLFLPLHPERPPMVWFYHSLSLCQWSVFSYSQQSCHDCFCEICSVEIFFSLLCRSRHYIDESKGRKYTSILLEELHYLPIYWCLLLLCLTLVSSHLLSWDYLPNKPNSSQALLSWIFQIKLIGHWWNIRWLHGLYLQFLCPQHLWWRMDIFIGTYGWWLIFVGTCGPHAFVSDECDRVSYISISTEYLLDASTKLGIGGLQRWNWCD